MQTVMNFFKSQYRQGNRKKVLILPLAFCLLAQMRLTASAQVVPDATLPNNSVVITNGNTIEIAGGTKAGNNLFHSFKDFSILTGSTAFFNNSLTIENIISRVTGGSISNIDGLIRVNGGANLFLLNPNGIIFGPNAALNIGGSFIGSTANSIKFTSGSEFSAKAVSAPPLLTVSVPVGLQYGGNSAGIKVQQSILMVQPEQTLALVGGNVTLEGGKITAPSGRVELGAVAGTGIVELTSANNQLQLGFPNGVDRADVSLTNGANANVSASGSGSIAINAQNLNMAGGSKLQAGIGSGLGSIGSQAGDIEINARAITLNDLSSISNQVSSQAVGNGGNINIQTESLSLTNGARLIAATYGQGDGGSVNIHAGSTVSFDGVNSSNGFSSGAMTLVLPGAVGKGGDVNVQTQLFSLTDGGQLLALSYGQGDTGSVNIHAQGTVSFDGVNSINGSSSGAATLVAPGAVGKGGDINIRAGSLEVTNGGKLLASTFGEGDAGSMNINAAGRVLFDGGGTVAFDQGQDSYSATAASSQVAPEAVGNGGNINIQAESLEVMNGARLTASTFGQGNTGSVNIHTASTVSFDGVNSSNGFASAALISVEPGAVGKGGGINIQTGGLSLTNGALLSATTFGQGNAGSVTINANTMEGINGGQVRTTSGSSSKAGNITLNVTDSVTLAGSDRTYNARLAQFDAETISGAGPVSGLFANTDENSTGQGGGLSITAGQLVVRDDAQVNVSSEGTGDAGTLKVKANSIFLNNQGSLSAATASGEGGNIFLQTQNLQLRHNSDITTRASGTGNGGNIDINTDLLVALENSEIIANAFAGRGGNIQIATQGLFKSQNSKITASSDFGVNGVVDIQTPDLDPSKGLVTLPQEVVDVTGLVAQGCSASQKSAASEFIVTGRGGLPPNPTSTIMSETVLADLGTDMVPTASNDSRRAISTAQTSPSPTRIVEAQGWVVNQNGQVWLTASAPSVTPHSPGLKNPACDRR